MTDEAGKNTDSYDYEAFWETLNKTGITENSYLYTGEQYDSGLDNYYLRARYYDPASTRFTQMDSWMGRENNPITLNKYIYGHNDTVNGSDPSGMSFVSLASAGRITSILNGVSTSSFSISPGLFGISTAGAGLAAGASFVTYAEYYMGFPTVTRNAEHEINKEAMILAATNATTNSNEKPIGHHSIPIYMCGAIEASRQQLVPLKPSVHVPLHSALVAYQAAINKAYKSFFTGSNKIFSLTNKKPLQMLAETPQGRMVITKHLRMFYNFGWFELGAPYFRGIFENESIKYIGGVTSLPTCQRP